MSDNMMLGFVTYPSQLRAQQPPPYVVKGMLTTNCVACITGQPGTGKSYVAVTIAACVATGRPFLGRQVKQGKAIVVCGEGFYQMKSRLAAFELHHNVTVTDNTLAIVSGNVTINNAGQLKDLLGDIDHVSRENGRPTLIVVDTLAMTFDGDENDSNSMRGYVANLRMLADKYECCVLVIHHSPKPVERTGPRIGAGAFRGSSLLYGALDVGFVLTKTEWGNALTLSCSAGKNPRWAEAPGDLSLALVKVDVTSKVGRDEDNNPSVDNALELAPVELVPASTFGSQRNDEKAKRYDTIMRCVRDTGGWLTRSDLAKQLKEKGYDFSDKTLGRDIEGLMQQNNLVKQTDKRRSVYAIPT